MNQTREKISWLFNCQTPLNRFSFDLYENSWSKYTYYPYSTARETKASKFAQDHVASSGTLKPGLMTPNAMLILHATHLSIDWEKIIGWRDDTEV